MIDKGDAAKEEVILALQEHFLSERLQDRLLSLGRQAGLLGLSAEPGAFRDATEQASRLSACGGTDL